MTRNWQNVQLGLGRTIFCASDDTLHSVPSEFLYQAREIDPDLIVLADSPHGWQEFVREQAEIERQWSLRQVLTTDDSEMLKSMGISWSSGEQRQTIPG
jgi:hypothetical protein